jgi:hypothetical protein
VVPGDGEEIWGKYIRTRGEQGRIGEARKQIDVPSQKGNKQGHEMGDDLKDDQR